MRLHPGSIVRDIMRERGWDMRDLARKLWPGPLPRQEFIRLRAELDVYVSIGHDHPQIDLQLETAEALARKLGMDVYYWLALHEDWRRSHGKGSQSGNTAGACR